MENWPEVRIESLAARGKFALATGPFGSSIGSSTFRKTGVPVIRGSNLSSDVSARLVDMDLVFINDDLADHFERSAARRDDLVFTCWGTINQIGLIDERARYDRYIVSNKQMKLTPDPAKVIPLYLYYFFSSPNGQRRIDENAIGSSVPGFNLTKLKSITVPLPNLATQRSIVEVLASLDDKIELNRRINETLDALTQAIFKDWFLDFGPVHRKQNGATEPVAIFGGLLPDPARADEVAALFPNGFGDDRLPLGWPQGQFASLVEIIGGGTPKTSEPLFWDGPIPWFSVVDTPAGSDTFVFNTEKSITEEGLAKSSARLVNRGATIISARGTVGNVAIAGRDMTFNQSCYALLSAEGRTPYFTFLTTKQAVEQLRVMAHGSVFSTITRQTFEGVWVAKAPIPVRYLLIPAE